MKNALILLVLVVFVTVGCSMFQNPVLKDQIHQQEKDIKAAILDDVKQLEGVAKADLSADVQVFICVNEDTIRSKEATLPATDQAIINNFLMATCGK